MKRGRHSKQVQKTAPGQQSTVNAKHNPRGSQRQREHEEAGPSVVLHIAAAVAVCAAAAAVAAAVAAAAVAAATSAVAAGPLAAAASSAAAAAVIAAAVKSEASEASRGLVCGTNRRLHELLQE